MRIGLVGVRCYRKGGMGRVLLELAEHLPPEAQVHVHAVGFEDVRCGRLSLHPVRALRRPFFLHQATFVANAQRDLDSGGYDLVHAMSMASHRQDVNFVNTCYASLAESMRAAGDGAVKTWLKRRVHPLAMIERRQVRGTRRVFISPSRGSARDLERFYGIPREKISLIPSGVDLEEFNPRRRAAARDPLRLQLGLSASDRVILFVGDEARRKGLGLLIDALSLVRDASVKLVVVSRSPAIPAFRERARRGGLQARVLFPGLHERVGEAMGMADLFALPSFYESQPLTALEAMASGLPVLGTRINGLEDDIADGVSGWLVRHDPHDIAAKIEAAFSDGSRLSRMGAAARGHAETLSWQAMADRTYALYQRLLERT